MKIEKTSPTNNYLIFYKNLEKKRNAYSYPKNKTEFAGTARKSVINNPL